MQQYGMCQGVSGPFRRRFRPISTLVCEGGSVVSASATRFQEGASKLLANLLYGVKTCTGGSNPPLSANLLRVRPFRLT